MQEEMKQCAQSQHQGYAHNPCLLPAHSPVPTRMLQEILSFQLNDLTFMLNMSLPYL